MSPLHRISVTNDQQCTLALHELAEILCSFSSLFIVYDTEQHDIFQYKLRQFHEFKISPERASNLDLPVLGSLAQREASVLANYATELG
uniref:Uncharacterized protein n=1 Tax=Timema bartmani TaxID=61472 RepID=A0A7R9I5S8_9NEOP|nr:unnamed protein product [Timema bartmani]